jgi:hypothetical protein
MFVGGSIILTDKGLGEALHSLVELSGVLRHTVLHLGLRVEGANQVELLGLDDAGTALFLDRERCTFLR